MSYRDPQQAIDNRYQNLATGLSGFFSSVNQGIDQWVTAEKTKKQKSRAILEKEIGGLDEEYQKGYSKVKSQANQFTGALGKEEGIAMSRQIEDALVSMGRDLSTQIQDAGGQDAPAATIRAIKNNMTLQMDNLYNDIVNFEAARIEYKQAKHLAPNQVGAILPGYNDELIHMFDASQDGTENNLMLSLDPETKHWRMSLIDGTHPDGSYNVTETLDVSDWSTKHADKDYFRHVEDMGKNPYASARRVVKELAPKFTNNNGVIDRVKLTEYLAKGDGKAALLPYVDEEDKEGHWRLIGDVKKDDNNKIVPKEGTWKDYDDSYDDELFLRKIIDNAILELPKLNFSELADETAMIKEKEIDADVNDTLGIFENEVA